VKTNQESRLKLFLEEYERLCKKYSLIVRMNCDEKYTVSERFWLQDLDTLARQMRELKKGGIDA